MKDPEKVAAPAWRDSALGTSTVAVMALVLALAAVLGLIDAVAAVQGCVTLAVIAAASLAAWRMGYSTRLSPEGFVCAQVIAVFLLLAYLTFRADDTPAAIAVLYLLAMLYGMLQLGRMHLFALALFALVTHGVAIFVLLDTGHPIDRAAAWTQFGALALAMAWITFAAGTLARLRARLSEAVRSQHDLARAADERARRDTLTGVFNQPHLMESLSREVSRAERLGKPLCVARVDLDALGQINEAWGSEAGDAALKRFVAVASGALRDVDVFGRFGGKEFLVLMPDTDARGAIVAAERIRNAVRKEPAHEVHGRNHLTCTLGIAEHARGGDTRVVLARAESALNFAKAAGRDRVVALGADGKPID